jgi:uncharacterized membrane protein HdeD (DUF308 family)
MTYPTSAPSLATVSAGHPRLGLYVGLFMILAGIVVAVGRSREAAKAWGAIGVVCGLVIGAIAVFDLFRERNRAVLALVGRSVHGSGPTAIALRAQLRSLVDFAFRPGIYLALLAAVLSVGAGVVFVLGRREAGTAPEVDSSTPQVEERTDRTPET